MCQEYRGLFRALTRYLDDGSVPIDNNRMENQIRPWELGRSNWLFAGSLRSGQRASAIMSLIQSAKLNSHDPYAYLKDVLTRLLTQKERHRRATAAKLETCHQGVIARNFTTYRHWSAKCSLPMMCTKSAFHYDQIVNHTFAGLHFDVI